MVATGIKDPKDMMNLMCNAVQSIDNKAITPTKIKCIKQLKEYIKDLSDDTIIKLKCDNDFEDPYIALNTLLLSDGRKYIEID